jgi:hypothetical protein
MPSLRTLVQTSDDEERHLKASSIQGGAELGAFQLPSKAVDVQNPVIGYVDSIQRFKISKFVLTSGHSESGIWLGINWPHLKRYNFLNMASSPEGQGSSRI